MSIFQRPVRTPRPPRRRRAQRFHWRAGASPRRYLIEHPEREIAEARGGMMTCRACNAYGAFLHAGVTPGEAEMRARAAADRHNAARHPRRWIRANHFQAAIPVEVRQRAACTCDQDVVCGPCMTGARA